MHSNPALDRDTLIHTAIAARERAYAPYSHYKVGAAILTESGKITPGCNVENASYSLCCCAERTALFTAVCSGEREVHAVAIATEDGGTPCGACRQALAEFSPEGVSSVLILLLDAGGQVVQETTLRELLPMAFNLKRDAVHGG